VSKEREIAAGIVRPVASDRTELLELEEMLPQLVVRALKLPPGADRRDTLILIGSFRDRIVAMKWAELRRATAQRTKKRFARRMRNGPSGVVPSPAARVDVVDAATDAHSPTALVELADHTS